MPTLEKNIETRQILIEKRDKIQEEINILSIRIASAKNYQKRKAQKNKI
jgi:hypothetical protein